MGTVTLLLAIIMFTLLGCLAGIITGLVPGIHVNNVAYMVMASQSFLVGLAVSLFGWASPSSQELLIIVCALVMGNVVTHTFLDFIPSVFLGAPDGDTALSLLPGHRMMLAGRGYEAVRCSVIGSLGALFLGLLLLVPLRLIIGSPVGAYDALAEWMPLLLLSVAFFLVLTETARPSDAFVGGRLMVRGHILLGGPAREMAQAGQSMAADQGPSRESAGSDVAFDAEFLGSMREAGDEYAVVRTGMRSHIVKLVSRPALMPAPGENVVVSGLVEPVVTWADHMKKRLVAGCMFLLAGLLGMALLSRPGLVAGNVFLVRVPSVDAGTVLLFPLFTGLFGLSTLLTSMLSSPQIPEQDTDCRRINLAPARQVKAIASGTTASIASWFPGISSAISTIISVFLQGESAGPGRESGSGTREFIISVSAVNTAVALFNLMALFVILRSRSGAMKAVERLLASGISPWEPLSNVPLAFSALLLSALAAGLVAAPLTLFLGRMFARHCARLNYALLVRGVIAFLVLMVLLLAGLLGLAILAVATCMGMLPPLLGVKRVHLMGCLIVPVIAFFV